MGCECSKEINDLKTTIESMKATQNMLKSTLTETSQYTTMVNQWRNEDLVNIKTMIPKPADFYSDYDMRYARIN